MESWFELPLDGPALNIVRQCGPALGDALYSKFGCVATFDGVSFDSSSSSGRQKKPLVVEEKRFSVDLTGGVRVSVWRADLTDFKVDAVVNAANSQLQHYGGLAQALSEAGGPQIQQDSDDYIKSNGDLSTGLATLSDAGSLPCKKIIHAVGPQLSSRFSDVAKAEPLLRKTIWSILDIVKQCSIKTVAIPAISSGLFNYPLDQCAMTIVSAVKDYCERQLTRGHVLEIMLVNHDEPTVREMERACRQILTPQMSPSYSQAAGGGRKHSAKSSALTVQIRNVLLTLMKGHIEEQQTNVIVNTISPDGDLKFGAISKALFTKAGGKMQREIPKRFPIGCIITTSGCNLQCLEVYHTCCSDMKIPQQKALHILYVSVLECLKRAVFNRHTSISFPAIGTGHLGLGKKDVALNMFKAVVDFSQGSHEEIAVNFVIYPSDAGTYEAFETQMKYLQHQTAQYSFAHSNNKSDAYEKDDVRPPIPKIGLIARSDEAAREATQWLRNLLFEPCHQVPIYNNFIQHFDEQAYNRLSRLSQNGVSVQESFAKGRASITVKGHKQEDVVVAALQVEAMLCHVQKEFISEERRMFQTLSTDKIFHQREETSFKNTVFTDVLRDFKKNGLQVVKIERVKNPALEKLFELKKKQIKCPKPKIMIQRVPAQFCEMVCDVGFHAECAPPEDPKLGEGIYFAHKVDAAMKLWKKQNEVYLYFVEAEVLRGDSTRGKPGLILPPALESDPQSLYDSVHGDDVTVIFSTYQALPKHIFTCKMEKNDILFPMRADLM
ncbi:protein mono-ADP-ribosyltransferase PARP9 [Betta splendens]|uniref:Protein mono-ADP-ribosyltransferase PARP9 n=1 Tax=Betta splendens TaxID=158456 RepID=A0A6P7LD50_BETSP|nr:protein mono-ADP-ribosyltransferase PARP9 [Betta splendens]